MFDLIRKESVEELCAHGARAMELYERASNALEEACKAHAEACKMKGGYAHLPVLLTDRNSYSETQAGFLTAMRKRLWQDMWHGFIAGSALAYLMDKEEKEKFRKELDKDPPPATVENVLATVERLVAESPVIFRRGLVNAFQRLSRDYRSNDGFKVGERIVLDYAVKFDPIFRSFSLYYSNRDDELRDVDRVMHVLDGKAPPEPYGGLLGSLRDAFDKFKATGEMTCETPYWRVRFFKKGTLHLFAKRKDLLDKANRMIAEHFGETLGTGHEAAKAKPNYHGRPDADLKEDYFPTPPHLAERMAYLAEIANEMDVLEPSAGDGDLVAAAAAQGGSVHAIEIDRGRFETLVRKGLGVKITHGDFMGIQPEPVYDRVIMNPPFSNLQSVRHVMHAIQFLKPGGKLVSVMPANALQREDRVSQALAALVAKHGHTIELPAATFKTAGTMVSTMLVLFNMPG